MERHGEVSGDMDFIFRNALWLCIVRIFLQESKSQIIPHHGCSYGCQYGSELDRIWIGYGANKISSGTGHGIHIAAWRHTGLLAANWIELIGYVLILRAPNVRVLAEARFGADSQEHLVGSLFHLTLETMHSHDPPCFSICTWTVLKGSPLLCFQIT